MIEKVKGQTSNSLTKRSPVGKDSVLEGFMAKIPFGTALFTRKGKLLSSNRLFKTQFNLSPDRKPLLGDFVSGQSPRDINGLLEGSIDTIGGEFKYTNRGSVISFSATLFVEENIIDQPLFVLVLHNSFNSKTQTLLETRNKELEAIQDQLDRLLYSSSHDLRAPIASMKGLLQLVEKEFDSHPKIRTYLERLNSCNAQLNRVVDGISSYTTITRKRYLSEKINIPDTVKSAIDKVSHLENFSRIDFQVSHSSELPFYGDPAMLRQVLKNIIKNAIQFQDTSKPVSFVKLTTQVISKKLFIEISDNGRGIPMPYVNKVFGMFYKATNSPKGVGLGLYIVKEVIHKLNGSVSIESAYKEGTTVRLEIPNGPKGRLMAQKINLKKQR